MLVVCARCWLFARARARAGKAHQKVILHGARARARAANRVSPDYVENDEVDDADDDAHDGEDTDDDDDDDGDDDDDDDR